MLASKEIRRSKVRFGLLSGAVGLLVFLILFQQALLGSLVQSFIGALENQSGEVVVFSAEARTNVAGSIITPDQEQGVSGVAGVGASSPLGQGTFTVEAGGEQRDASIFGFEPGGPGEPTKVVSGRLPESPIEAVASREDRADGFAVGDSVTSVTGAVPLTIVGLTEESRYSVSPTLFVTFDGFTQLRTAANPDARTVLPSVLAVTPEGGTSSDELAARITNEVEGVEALTRADAVAGSPGVSSVNTSFQVILALAFVVVALVIGFFFLILTVQKLPSLALLRAMGAPTGYLLRSILVQIVVVVAGGLLVGVALTVLSLRLASQGLPVSLNWTTTLMSAAGIVVLALLGSTVALVRVARLDPASVVGRQNLGGLG